jgi:methyl-accepting chemotaxis protein
MKSIPFYFNNMKISKKLLLSHSLILFSFLVISIYVIFALQKQDFDSLRINVAGRQRMLLQKMTKQAYLDIIRSRTNALQNLKTDFSKENIKSTINLFHNSFDVLLNGGTVSIGGEQASIPKLDNPQIQESMDTVYRSWLAFRENMLNFLNTENSEALEYVATQNEKLISDVDSIVLDMQRFSEEKLSRIYYWILIGIAFSIFVFILALFISRSIVKSLNRFQKFFFQGAKGDLTSEYPLPEVNCSKEMGCSEEECSDFGKDAVLCFIDVGSYAPDFGKEVQCPKIKSGTYESCKVCKVYKYIAKNEINATGAWYNKFVRNLRESIANLKQKNREMVQAGENLAANSHQSASSVQEISVSTRSVVQNILTQKEMVNSSYGNLKQMLNDIEETNSLTGKTNERIDDASSAIEQMAANISSTTRMTQKGDHAAENLAQASTEGNEAIESLIESIHSVAKNADQIVEMIQLIMDISEQTNLLAMNAAIEAAHAGEYGKGFAVVAEEIRKLADRSSSSAKEIQSVVKNIDSSIKENMKNSEKTQKSYEVLKNNIEKVKQITHEIASSMAEQESANQSVLDFINLIKESGKSIREKTARETQWGKEIDESLNNLVRISEEISTAMEEEKNALQEAAASSEEISHISNELKDIAKTIEEDFSKFQTV